jgi:hypothetical protein
MEAVLAPTPENVKRILSVNAKKTHKRRNNMKHGRPTMKKGRYVPLNKRTKTEQASDNPAME